LVEQVATASVLVAVVSFAAIDAVNTSHQMCIVGNIPFVGLHA